MFSRGHCFILIDQWLYFLFCYFRLAKEVGYYEKEAVREQARQDTMKNEGKDEYDIKKQVCCDNINIH